jgi:hypothetical protein
MEQYILQPLPKTCLVELDRVTLSHLLFTTSTPFTTPVSYLSNPYMKFLIPRLFFAKLFQLFNESVLTDL